MFKVLICSIKRHWLSLILHFLLIHQNLSGSFLKEVHFSPTEIKFLIILVLLDLLLLLLLVVHVAFVFLLDGIVMLLWPNILSDEKVLFFIGDWHLLSLVGSVSHSCCLFIWHETHLLMVWRGEYLFVLCLPCELWREDLTLNISVWSNIWNWECHTLVHHLCVQILSFYILLPFSGQKLDWVWIREASMALLLTHFSQVGFITLNFIIN